MNLKNFESKLASLKPLLDAEIQKQSLQSDLIAFTRHFFEASGQRFIENTHHKLISDALSKVQSGEIQNLVINIPPRYSKTLLAVINHIAQSIAINPAAKFIHLSYSNELALENSSRTRELITSDEYQKLWPVKLKSDSDSKQKWWTEQGGGVYATAAGGAITGFGAGSTEDTGLYSGAIIIDDPHKVDDIDRERERQRVCERLNTTIQSRRNSRKTPIIIIMQRLHEDDMSGYVLAGKMGEKFHHLNLQAIQEDGTALWPHKHTLEDLNKMRLADIRTFNAQYQQDPTPDDGEFFKREWFKRYDFGDYPDLCMYGASDYAVSEGKGDFTEQGVAGFDEDFNLWFVDWWSGQTTADIWIDAQIKMARRYEPMVWVAESGVIRRSVEPFLKKEQDRKATYYRLEWIASNKDKAANARAFQALCSQGKVYIPNCDWGDDLIEHLIKFPAGKHDDKVDVCGLFGRILDSAFNPDVVGGFNKPVYKDPYGLDDDEHDAGWII